MIKIDFKIISYFLGDGAQSCGKNCDYSIHELTLELQSLSSGLHFSRSRKRISETGGGLQ